MQGYRSKNIKDLPALLQFLNHEGEEDEVKSKRFAPPVKVEKTAKDQADLFVTNDEFDPGIKIGRESKLYLKRNYVERLVYLCIFH